MEEADLKIEVKSDNRADTVYLYFSNGKVTLSKELDKERTVDYSEDGEIRSIRFSRASTGLKTADLPHRSAIERALYESGISGINDRLDIGFRKETVNPVKLSPQEQMKAKMRSLIYAAAAILVFIGLIVADVALSRNLFVLNSPLEQVASLFGLTATLFPTVLGCFVLLVFLLDTRSEDSEF